MEEFGDGFGVEGGAGVGLIVVVAVDFAEPLGRAGGGEVGLGMSETNEGVVAAVENEDRDLNLGEPGAGVVAETGEGADGEEGKEFDAEVGDAGEGAAEDEAAETGAASGEFGGDAAAEAFAMGHDAVFGEAELNEPVHGGFGVEVGAVLGGPSATATVAAVVVGEDMDPDVEEEGVEGEAVADVAAVAMADDDREIGKGGVGRGREVPAAEFHAVAGGEPDGVPGSPERFARDGPGAGGLEDVGAFEPEEEEPECGRDGEQEQEGMPHSTGRGTGWGRSRMRHGWDQ